MVSSLVGFAILVIVFTISLSSREGGSIGFFDWHAMVVVFGGVIGSLLIALEKNTCFAMLKNLIAVMSGWDKQKHELEVFMQEINLLRTQWREGQRSQVLELMEKSQNIEIKEGIESLIQKLSNHRLKERFVFMKTQYLQKMDSQIEGWDLIARISPSFGMVGTVTGMVQLFKNMASASGNLGGAMAMALLATLYGIGLGTAVGGPMSSRLNHQVQQKLNLIDLLEQTVASLVEDEKLKNTGEI